ncbi:aminotransferase [Magnetococcus marinus MC-1]|uniref:Aminotransferase n=1 Tax=Magnetococcus marinus (strain ATCC BAA-1437 / JCM 17883 / MC-1) TaxID=156889 RepID=A0L6S8_MAGMM|nr:pyridoxal phosphate-dependent aminotransferase [Magnetococcus marinus]ABK43671.1 aminotransferase [Magnetococcus marinus MC-1]
MQISQTVQNAHQALSIFINQMIYDLKHLGEDVTVLSLGESFFEMEMDDFSQLDLEKINHYSDSQGIPALRKKLAHYYQSRYRVTVNPDQELIISVGAKSLIYMAMLATLEPGDDVLIWEPAWLSYPEQAKLVHAKPRFIPYDLPVEQLDTLFTDKTRMVVLCNPNNPSGRVYNRAELQRIHTTCAQAGAWLLVDEVYSDFVLDEPFVSLGELVPDFNHLIIINSLSKNLGISGWRIGYAIGPEPLIAALLRINQHVITCTGTPLLHYCNHYFDKLVNRALPQVEAVMHRRKRIKGMLQELGLDEMAGSATFYHFVHLGDYPGNAFAFAAQLLLDHHISVVPGYAYGENVDRFIRISIGWESEERIWLALQSIKNVITGPAPDPRQLRQRLLALPSVLSNVGFKEVVDEGLQR